VSPGSHAAGDGSFSRSASLQVGRAVILLGVAVLIGLLLLRRAPSGGGTVASVTSTTKTTSRTTTASSSPFSSSPTTRGIQLRAHQDIKVLVANATSTRGLAGTVSTTLHGKGYDTLASTNASVQIAKSAVYFQPTYDADAIALAGVLGLQATAAVPMPAQPPVPSLNGSHILVVVGADLANGTPGTGTTSTSRSTSSTTSHSSTT
jgi:hypothetical protein